MVKYINKYIIKYKYIYLFKLDGHIVPDFL